MLHPHCIPQFSSLLCALNFIRRSIQRCLARTRLDPTLGIWCGISNWQRPTWRFQQQNRGFMVNDGKRIIPDCVLERHKEKKAQVAGNIRLHVGFMWIYLDFTEIDGLKNRGGGNMRLPVRISSPWRPAMMESPKYGDVNLAYFLEE